MQLSQQIIPVHIALLDCALQFCSWQSGCLQRRHSTVTGEMKSYCSCVYFSSVTIQYVCGFAALYARVTIGILTQAQNMQHVLALFDGLLSREIQFLSSPSTEP